MLTVACERVESVTVHRIQDARTRRLPFQQKIGAGLSRDQFLREVDRGSIRHVGLAESISMIADALGRQLDRITDEVKPKMADATVSSEFLAVDPGYVSGIIQDGVVSIRSGEPLRLSQASGIGNSRPDYNGGNQVLDDWRDTLQYLDRSAYTPVPTYALTRATVRPGTQNPSQLEAPGRRRVDLTIAKSFTLRGRTQLQVRAESFNVSTGGNTTTLLRLSRRPISAGSLACRPREPVRLDYD